MFRILSLALALSPLALSGCGTAQAIADYNAAGDAFDAYKAEKAAKGLAGYESGMALHAKYMANALKPDANIYDATGWFETQEENMANIDKLFEPVSYSEFYEKMFLVHRAMGQGWDKLALDLDSLFEKGLKGRSDSTDQLLNLDHAIETAQVYYKRVRDDFNADHPDIVKKHADKVAEAKARIEALSVLKTKYRPK